jgi:AcrR family transcriptional regulator
LALSSVGRLRDRHTEVTRRAILEAAREAFAEEGYARTSVKSLAERAGVALQTIYDTFGSKAGVVLGLTDLLDERAGVLDLAEELGREEVPARMLAISARVRRQIRERCGDIVRTLRAGAAVESDVAAAWAEGMSRRHRGLAMSMDRIAAKGALREGLTAQAAADIAAAIVADEVCDVLVEQRGWTFDAYESWLADTLAALLLRPSRRPRRG